MRISKKIIIALSSTAMIALMGAAVYWDSYFFVVNKIEIKQRSTHLHPEILQKINERIAAHTKPFKKKNIWHVDLAALRNSLLTERWLQTVTIERILPDGINIEVTSKQVVMIHRDRKGRTHPISTDGEVLEAIPFAQSPDVPLIKTSAVLKDTELLQKIIALYQALPKEGALSRENVAQLDWSERSGLSIELVSSEEGAIILGVDNVTMKAKRVANVLKYLESQKQKWRVIDASFSKKVLVRLRKHS